MRQLPNRWLGKGRRLVKVKIKGVNTTRKRLADGSISGAPLPRQPAFLVAFTEAEKIQPKGPGNVNELIRDYWLSLTSEKKRQAPSGNKSGC